MIFFILSYFYSST